MDPLDDKSEDGESKPSWGNGTLNLRLHEIEPGSGEDWVGSKMLGDGRRLPSPETSEGSDGDWTRDFLRNSETPGANTSLRPFPTSTD